ncbi:MAG: hypothetical protein ILP10_06005, partial [Lachnospiraceae bacterium]|nr:hypothetical protein [Lachnospiraceae bacterium]
MFSFLPQSFLDRMEKMLGAEYEDFLASYGSAHHSGLRSNSLKISPSGFEKLDLFNLKRIPWIDNGFYYSGDEDTPSKHPLYYGGVYYIQEPSAMTPASLLPVTPGDRVLDLCAAPGGKTIHAADILKLREHIDCEEASVRGDDDSAEATADCAVDTRMEDTAGRGKVISCDISEKKLSLIRENVLRC